MKKKEKHEKAKQIVSHFLDNADYWTEIEYLSNGLSKEEINETDEELYKLIGSIRKRFNIT